MKKIIITLYIIAGLGVMAIFFTLYGTYNDSQLRQQKAFADLQSKIIQLENKPAPIAPAPQIIRETKTVYQASPSNAEPDLSAIIAEWTPRVAFVICRWGSDIASGSATLGYLGDVGISAITNKHVIVDGTYIPNKCIIAVGSDSYTIDWTNGVSTYLNPYYPGTLEDYGYIRIDTTETSMMKYINQPLKLCTSVNIGDKLVVLGYPGIGSNDGITATEGIVSGIEQDYYVTSAKIEHGNSGGAAILLKDDCWLGIPSAAVIGSAESMGRILKSSFVIK